MKSSFHSLIPFMPSLLNHSTAISRDSLKSDSIPLLPSSYPDRLASPNSTDSNDLFCPFYNLWARIAQKTQLLYCCVYCFCRNMFTQLFLSKGYTHHILYRENSCTVACGQYLATAVFSGFTVLALSKYATEF
jgi:hypothetical protein